MKPILQFCDVSFRYPGATRAALSGANLTVLPGQKIALLGRNGAGKSTLLLHGNGILRPAVGKIHVAGAPVTYDRRGLARVRQQVGLIFQNPDDQLFSASVRQDIGFGPLNLGLSSKDAEQRVQAAANQCNVLDLLDRPTYALSGGQKARVALAGVLAMQPQLLLVDEALSGLDPWMRAQMLALFDVLARQGVAIVLSTHDLDVARRWPDQIALMENGQVVFVAPPDLILSDPLLRSRCGFDLHVQTDVTGDL